MGTKIYDTHHGADGSAVTTLVRVEPTARRIIRTENVNGVFCALWDDGKGGRFYEPLHDHNDEPLW